MRPSLLTWLCTSLSAACLGLVELSCPLTQSRASSTSGTVSSAAYPCCVELLTISYHILSQARRLEISNVEPGDCAAVCSRSASLHLASALLSALSQASKIGTSLRVIVWVICASHGTCGVAAVFLHDLDLFLKLRHVEEFLGCPHFIWDISPCKTRDANFGLFT